MTTKNSLDLAAVIAATEQEIETLTAQRSQHALAAFRKAPGAEAAFTEAEGKLEAARRVLSQAQVATLEFAREQEVAEVARTAAETKRLEKDRAEAEGKLTEALRTTEGTLQVLAEAVIATLAAADKHYNSGVAMGLNSVSTGTRNHVTDRISRVLNMVGLIDLAYGLTPAASTPLGEVSEQLKVAPPGPASGEFAEYESRIEARHSQEPNGKSKAAPDEILVMVP